MGDNEKTTPDPSPQSLGPIRRLLVDRLLTARLPAPLARRVHRFVRSDPAALAYYEQHRQLERAAAKGPALTHDQQALLKKMLFSGPAFEKAEAPASAPSPPRRLLLATSLATAAAAVALFLVVGEPAEPQASAWTPRGGAEQALGFRVRCLAADRRTVLEEAEAGTKVTLGPPLLGCPHDGLLAFSATNLSEEPAHFFVVGLTSEGEVRWYAPFDDRARAAEVPPGAVDHLMPALAGLSGMPDDERVALFAIFSPEPLHADEVVRSVEAIRRQGLSLPALSRLPLDASAQVRIDLERKGGGG